VMAPLGPITFTAVKAFAKKLQRGSELTEIQIQATLLIHIRKFLIVRTTT